MALTSTIYRFDIDLADADRHLYESLSLHVACHPSESDEHLVARVLAYALEYTEGIEFTRGLSEPEWPAILVRDLTGAEPFMTIRRGRRQPGSPSRWWGRRARCRA